MAMLHANMDDCQYCPDLEMNSGLCQSVHKPSSDSLTFSIDPIDAKSFVLFEIPAVSILSPTNTSGKLPQQQAETHFFITSPLTVTGILRI